MTRWGLLTLGVLGLALLQTSAVPAFDLLGVGANLLLVVMCCWVVVHGTRDGMVLAPLAGVWMGLLSIEGIAVSVAAYLPVVALASLHRPLGIGPGLTWAAPLVVAATILHFFVIAVSFAVEGSSINWLEAITEILLPSVLVNFVVALPVYWLIRLPAGRPQPRVVRT